MPAQLLGPADGTAKVLFLAQVPSVGFAVYDVRHHVRRGRATTSELKVNESSLENARYRVSLDGNGDVASIFDKQRGARAAGGAGPAGVHAATSRATGRRGTSTGRTSRSRPTLTSAGRPQVRIVEDGPARVALEVTREAEGSRFVQTVRLAAGEAGDRVEFHDIIDWRSTGCNLKAVFPLSVSQPAGDLQLGSRHDPARQQR